MRDSAKIWVSVWVVIFAIAVGACGGILSFIEIPRLKAELTSLQFDYYKSKGVSNGCNNN